MPYSAWFGTLPWLGHPQPPWTTCTVPHHPHSKELLPNTYPNFPPLQFVPITPCPITTAPDEESLSGFPVGPFGYWILLHSKGHRLRPGRAATCPLLPDESSAYHPPEKQRARREQPLTSYHPGAPPRLLGQGRSRPSSPWGHLPARTGASFTTATSTTNPLGVARRAGDRYAPAVPGTGPLLTGGGGAGETGGVFVCRTRNTGARSPVRPPRCHSTATRRGGPPPYPHAAIKGGGEALRHLLTARRAVRRQQVTGWAGEMRGGRERRGGELEPSPHTRTPPTGRGCGSPRAERGRVAAGPTGTKAARRKMAGAA